LGRAVEAGLNASCRVHFNIESSHYITWKKFDDIQHSRLKCRRTTIMRSPCFHDNMDIARLSITD